jgi:hypothetical protein
MPHLLKNKILAIEIELPAENYQQSRFDWTGKIVSVKYLGKKITSQELPNSKSANIGEGLYNEFGFKLPLGYHEIPIGGYFHKIGIGLLRKEDESYDFLKPCEVTPATFTVEKDDSSIKIQCVAPIANGYAYSLKKEIRLHEHDFTIAYHLTNTGEKTIRTNEYTHNFLAINEAPISKDYKLTFPFEIKPDGFDEHVDLENILAIGGQEIKINNHPNQPYFLSDLSGGQSVGAGWTLENTKEKIGISESGNFESNWVALWGAAHVISPELFIDLSIAPGQTKEWSRRYKIYDIDTE